MSSTKVVLITGCSKGGIGFALAEEFIRRGYITYATARNLSKMDGLPTTSNVHRLELDVTSDENVSNVITTILEEQKKIDIVVNNAGMMVPGAAIDLTMEEAKKTIDTNFFSVLRVAKAVIPVMASRRSGTIVNIGSVAGNVTTPWDGLYDASKAAVHSISETLFMECKPFNIDICLIAPGFTVSNMATNSVLNIPKSTLYTEQIDTIHERVKRIASDDAMPLDKFATKVVNHVTKPHPSFYLTLGGQSGPARILELLPRQFRLNQVWKIFGGK